MASKTNKTTATSTVRNIRRKSRKRYSGEEKIRIVLEGLRGEQSVAELCRREGISETLDNLEGPGLTLVLPDKTCQHQTGQYEKYREPWAASTTSSRFIA